MPAATAMNTGALNAFIFYCSHHLEPGCFSALGRANGLDLIKAISLPCSGKLDIPYLVKAFETGADAVAIVTCQKGDCRHFEGNLRARKRAEGVEALLEEIGLPGGRVAVFECHQQGTELVLTQIRRFIEGVRQLASANIRTNPMAQEGKAV